MTMFSYANQQALTLDPTLLSELSTQNQEQLHSHHNKKDAIQISWAQNDNEVKEAQQLRYKVFAEEMRSPMKLMFQNKI